MYICLHGSRTGGRGVFMLEGSLKAVYSVWKQVITLVKLNAM